MRIATNYFIFKRITCVTLFLVLAFVASSAASRADILVDMSQSTGEAVSTSPSQFRINHIDVSFPNNQTGQIDHMFLDVVFEWDPATLSLKPVDIVGCQSGRLRIQVGCSITGEPLPDAVVKVGDKSALTDEDGIARFDRLPNKPLVVRVEKQGYEAEGMIVEIPCGQWMRKAVRLLQIPQ